MQAAYFHSWLCPSSSTPAAAVTDAPQASLSVAAWSSSPEPYVVIDAKTAAAVAAAAAAGSNVDAAGVLVAAGCVHVQSFVLLDIKWSLQAQVGMGGGGLGGGSIAAPSYGKGVEGGKPACLGCMLGPVFGPAVKLAWCGCCYKLYF
jgi:hypothetical protein